MKRSFLVLAALLLTLTGFAQGKYAGYDALVELDSTHVSVKENGSGTFDICRRIKFLTGKGALDNRAIVYGYDPLTAFACFKEARIIHTDGEVTPVDISDACDYAGPANMIYWGSRQIMLEIGRMSAGDVLEYEIEKKGFTYALLADGGNYFYMKDNKPDYDESRFIPPMYGQFYDIVPLWVDTPTVRKVYTGTFPSSMKIISNVYNGKCDEKVEESDGGEIRTYTMTDLFPLIGEKGQVDWYDCGPMLLISSTPTWETKSKWFNHVNEEYGSFKAYGPAQKKVDEIIKGKKTDMEKISALTHWVADNIRYAGLTMGKGEGYTLHSCKMDYTDRCGVCKDIAGTLISFLRMAGFEAYPAMTMAGSKIMHDVPVDHFNHCVVVCKLSDGTYMPLDPTWVPFTRELWSSAEQQQNYLPGIPEGSNLRETPLSPAADHYLRISSSSKLSADGTLKGTVTVSAEGQTDRYMRRIFTSGWQSQWKGEMESQLLAVSPLAKLVKVDWGKDPKDYLSGPLSITFTYEIPRYAVLGVGHEMMFKPLSLNNFYNSLKTYLRFDRSLETRKYGFKDACSREVDIVDVVKVPRGYSMVDEPREASSDGTAASFKGSLTCKGGRITLTQTLKLNKRVYEASDWEAFRNAVNGSESFDSYITVKK
ncbi:MAG: DUF3857 domain-containing protein [Bacteroidales bacterium]|jgi:hypothetical protein|nr:DUF3857 domain-containing protein [Bacteroidales bacterium]MCI2145762.1 DUF3857 domain-containing protein [Bacteroidales bacterium]